MEPIKEKLERTLKNWDSVKITVKQDGKYQQLPLSKVKSQKDIAKYLMLVLSPYLDSYP